MTLQHPTAPSFLSRLRSGQSFLGAFCLLVTGGWLLHPVLHHNHHNAEACLSLHEGSASAHCHETHWAPISAEPGGADADIHKACPLCHLGRDQTPAHHSLPADLRIEFPQKLTTSSFGRQPAFLVGLPSVGLRAPPRA